MPVINCPIDGCKYKTEDVSEAIVIKLLEMHTLTHTASQPARIKGPKLSRPTIDVGANEEIWNTFKRRWETFMKGSGIQQNEASAQLFECAGNELSELALRLDPTIASHPTDKIMSTLHSLAVIPVAIGVTRAELMKMKQKSDETFRTFAARVKGKAETCDYQVEVFCGKCENVINAQYATETMKDVLLAGILDIDIRREALNCEGLIRKPINQLISFVERREMSKSAAPEVNMSAISSFKRGKNKKLIIYAHGERQYAKPNYQETRSCPSCHNLYKPYKQGRNGWNKRPYHICFNCWKKKSQECAAAQMNHCVSTTSRKLESKVSSFILSHRVFNNNWWRKANKNTHPTLYISISHVGSSRSAVVNVIADTGAQSNLWGYNDFISKGFSKKDLSPVTLRISAANNQSLNIIGAFRAKFSGKSPKGENVCCRDVIYVSDSVSHFYLSCSTMMQLGIIGKNFPTVGDCDIYNTKEIKVDVSSTSLVRALKSGCADNTVGDLLQCSCPQRECVPPRPNSLPFSAIPENNNKMRKWLINQFKSSTFNTCPHRPLQQMVGPPMEIHISEDAKPKVCYTAAPIPLHWQQKVYDDLIRDEALGVIEKVPYGVPVSWCHRMVVTRKHDGTPRRTVDLSPLNRYCKREIYSSESPFRLARRIPQGTWKTVTDAWNGYHSVPLRKCDSHLTTFVTPFGRWRYIRAPQGFLSSGDGYNRRFEAILTDFERKERCVDDTIHYDSDLEAHWWRTIDFLILVGKSGIVLNPDKFQFAQKTVEFAGFRISENNIEPLPKFLDAIKSFPTPVSNTDIRSWYGLINQVSNYAQLRDCLAPFRQFLSAKSKFSWSGELDQAFEKSKLEIIKAIRKGVEIFDVALPTCLRPDWSSRGIGYFLLQKHCKCKGNMPQCCSSGWKITLAGSRFLQNAEKNYAAIEGEALALAWALEQTRYFTQGCSNLMVITDHKPLVKIFRDRTLDQITNTRLFRLKQRTLPWYFEISYLPGKTNHMADAMSRYPSPNGEVGDEDRIEAILVASIESEAQDLTTISWEIIADKTKLDPVLSKLIIAIDENFKGSYPELQPYLKHRDALYKQDGVVILRNRVVIPTSLRTNVLSVLHSAHQGVLGMGSRARSIVFWPGMTRDIEKVRENCSDCNRNAPSQAHLPSLPVNPPTTPFEKIYADFFQYGSKHYLIIGDRLSGWTDVYAIQSNTFQSGANALVRCLRIFFATYGVPEEISTDGGPEFMADICKTFLRRWDVKHRVSSAYFPRSNGRAEVSVKSIKRLLRSNIGPGGSLNNDRFLQAILQHRNTPGPLSGVSPSEILFGRPIKDKFSFTTKLLKFSNSAYQRNWREAWARKERAIRSRYRKSIPRLNFNSRIIPPLKAGDRCLIQNQHGNYPRKWERSGTITKVLPFNKYELKVDGSGRLTIRNRKFIRRLKMTSTAIQRAPLRYWDSPETITESSPNMINDGDENQPSSNTSSPCFVPYMLKRLAPFNKPGLKEDTSVPQTRLRPRQV